MSLRSSRIVRCLLVTKCIDVVVAEFDDKVVVMTPESVAALSPVEGARMLEAVMQPLVDDPRPVDVRAPAWAGASAAQPDGTCWLAVPLRTSQN